MILSLFRKTETNPAAPLYSAIVAAARQADWYRDAGVPDSMDGRYCVLATLLALADLRLAAGGPAAQALAPRLTETFIDDMDAQLCQSGMGDPTLGKTVRGMVAGVSARIGRWRPLLEREDGDWLPALRFGLYREFQPNDQQAAAARALVEAWHGRLQRAADERLHEGLPQ